MIDPKKIIYSINVEDVQTVAIEEFDKTLTENEIKLVEDKIGDYIDWFEVISFVLSEVR